MNRPRIVITGLGAVSALGSSLPETYRALLRGESGARPVTAFDVSQTRCKQAAFIEQLPDISGLCTPHKRRPLSRASHLAIAAAFQALDQAACLSASHQSLFPTLPLVLSTTGGGMSFGETFLRRSLQQKRQNQLALLTDYQPQHQALCLSKTFSLHGSATLIGNACASGANAIGHGADLIRAGRAELVLTGGVDALSELIFCGFDSLQALSPTLCKPFDLERNGLLIGEGAAFLVLESEAHALARGAHPLAVLSGYGQSTDLHHLTQPQPEGHALRRALAEALTQAQISGRDVCYVNAHGTGTPANDRAEALALCEQLGEESPFQLSSTKSALGHTLGAAGALEAALCVHSFHTAAPPPQINTQSPEPLVASRLVPVADESCARSEGEKSGARISVNLGFGGSNAALIFSSAEVSS